MGASVALRATERADAPNSASMGAKTEPPQRLAQLRRAQSVVAARVRNQQFLQQRLSLGQLEAAIPAQSAAATSSASQGAAAATVPKNSHAC